MVNLCVLFSGMGWEKEGIIELGRALSGERLSCGLLKISLNQELVLVLILGSLRVLVLVLTSGLSVILVLVLA